MNRLSSLISLLRPGCLALAAAALLGGVAGADPVTFGQFRQTTGGNDFVFTDNGTSATFTASTLVNFQFQSVTGVPTGEQLATLSLSLSTTAAASTGFGQIFQPIDPGGTLSIIRTSDGANLLTVDFTDLLSGAANSRAAGLSGATSTIPPDTVTFTSDFLDFTGSFDRSIALSFTSLITRGTGAGLTLTGSFIDSFTAAGTGTFSSDFRAVPEPASLAMLSAGGLGLLGYARRRKARATA